MLHEGPCSVTPSSRARSRTLFRGLLCMHAHGKPFLTPAAVACRRCLNVLRAGLIASRVDLCGELFPGVIAAPLVVGTIGGSGGRFSIDAVLAGFDALDGACGCCPIEQKIYY